MAFKSVTEFSPSIGRRGGNARHNQSSLVFATDLSKNSELGAAIRITVYPDLAKQARLIEGDRVDVLFDADARLGMIKRVASGGVMLSRRTGLAKGQPAKETTAYSIKFTYRRGMPSIMNSTACVNVVVNDEGILFEFPKEASFTELLLKKPIVSENK